MPRIAGVDIPADKPIWVSLTYLYGIGPANSRVILQEAAIEPQRRAKELTEEELAKIIGIIDREYLVEGALRRQINQNIGRLQVRRSFSMPGLPTFQSCQRILLAPSASDLDERHGRFAPGW